MLGHSIAILDIDRNG